MRVGTRPHRAGHRRGLVPSLLSVVIRREGGLFFSCIIKRRLLLACKYQARPAAIRSSMRRALHRQIGAALSLAGNARFFEIELALDAAARFVGDLAIAQQL